MTDKPYKTPRRKKEQVCFACGENCPTDWHHILPRSEGGTNARRNLIELCVPCHDIAEEAGWSWISSQHAAQYGGFSNMAVARKRRPQVALKAGESLRFNRDQRRWEVWGVDSLGIYCVEP